MEWKSDPEFEKEWEERLLAPRGPDPDDDDLPDLVPQREELIEEGAPPPLPPRLAEFLKGKFSFFQ